MYKVKQCSITLNTSHIRIRMYKVLHCSVTLNTSYIRTHMYKAQQCSATHTLKMVRAPQCPQNCSLNMVATSELADLNA